MYKGTTTGANIKPPGDHQRSWANNIIAPNYYRGFLYRNYVIGVPPPQAGPPAGKGKYPLASLPLRRGSIPEPLKGGIPPLAHASPKKKKKEKK